MKVKWLEANQAFVFTFGGQIVAIDGQRFFSTMKEAREAARREGIAVDRSGNCEVIK